jgi:serine/threonine protein kinase
LLTKFNIFFNKKPPTENILMNQNGVIKICDLGLATFMAKSDISMTTGLGTPGINKCLNVT